ncbi:transcription factor 7-like 1-A isoform X2 [Corythoichthys intestinalis]|uniref:transcription factor 7-like 1-A isoform X2 n=1 Tax=Corythoichthys intestinalis TaxID=161448 RepID=UPI0025A5953E|nr:transcription factor 7-like 1-A isoform X2 [Corythoichthys intestinalis]
MHPIRPECHPRPRLPTLPVGPRLSQQATMMPGPNMYNIQQQIRPPLHLNSHAGFHNHSQQMPPQWPVQNVLGPHPQQMMRPPSAMMMTPGAPQMVPVGFMNGEILFEQVHPLMSAAPPQNIFTTINTRKNENVRERPYIKKPPNAFMLFANKYREVVTMQLEKRDSASVHVALGKIWKLLPQADRDKYHEEADAQKRRHAQLYPRWSTCENYGKRRKRRKSKIHANVTKDTPDPLPHASSMCLSAVQKDITVSEEMDSSSEAMHYNSLPPSALDSEESVEALIEEKSFMQMPCVQNELSITTDGQTQGGGLEIDHALNLLDCMLLSPASQIELQSVEDGFQLFLGHIEPQGLPLQTEADEYTKPLSLGESQQLIIKLFESPGNLKVETQLDRAMQGHTVSAGPSKPLNKPIQLPPDHNETAFPIAERGHSKEEIQPCLIAHCQTLVAGLIEDDGVNEAQLEPSSNALTVHSQKVMQVCNPPTVHNQTTESSKSLIQDIEIPLPSEDLETSSRSQSQKLVTVQSVSKENVSPNVETLSASTESQDRDVLQCLSFGDELQF